MQRTWNMMVDAETGILQFTQYHNGGEEVWRIVPQQKEWWGIKDEDKWNIHHQDNEVGDGILYGTFPTREKALEEVIGEICGGM